LQESASGSLLVIGRPLKKRLAGPTASFTMPCYFGFDSLARVCFLSLSGVFGFVVPARLRQTKKQ
jgi:hypothetical protein